MRVRGVLWRSCSRWVRNAPISGASRSARSSWYGCLPVCCSTNASSSRKVPPPDRSAPVAAGQQAAHDLRLDPARQRAISEIRDTWHRPHQRRADQPRHMQIAQQRPQPGHQLPSARHAPPRALPRQELAHVRSRQRLKSARLLPLQEQARNPLIATDRQRRQPTLRHQVIAIPREHSRPRSLAHDSRRWRHNPDLAQIHKRQLHAPRRHPRDVPSLPSRRQEQLGPLLVQLPHSQPLALKPATQPRQLTHPLTHRQPRVPARRQPPLKPSRPRRQRPPHPAPRHSSATHRCSPSDRTNRKREASISRGRLCSAARDQNQPSAGKTRTSHAQLNITGSRA